MAEIERQVWQGPGAEQRERAAETQGSIRNAERVHPDGTRQALGRRELRVGREERRRDAPPAEVEGDARYEQFLKENPRVRAAVDSGTITKEQVLARIEARGDEEKTRVPGKDKED